jgi:hypothetical protein
MDVRIVTVGTVEMLALWIWIKRWSCLARATALR